MKSGALERHPSTSLPSISASPVRVNEQPFVSVVIPCRNEQKYIARCLESILKNDYPRDRMEILVLDGMSEDGTRTIVTGYLREHPSLRLVDNPAKSIPAAVNLGVKHARGIVIAKIDAHSTYTKDYIRKCVSFLEKFDADNVGGVLKICPGGNTTMAKSIALVLSHVFGSGNAYVKIGCKEPRWADAVSYGCFKKKVFDTVGLWNEDLAGSPDMDFNVRLKKAGGKVLLVPEIVTDYYADKDLQSLVKHNFADGVWATYVMKFGSRAWSWRHWIPMIFLASVVFLGLFAIFIPKLFWLFVSILGAYAIANLAASAQIALRERKAMYVGVVPFVFAARHFAHGLGALYGLVLTALPGKLWKGRRNAKG